MISSEIFCCMRTVEMNVIKRKKETQYVFYFLLTVEIKRGCSFIWYDNHALFRFQVEKKPEFFLSCHACLIQTHPQSSAHTCQSPAPTRIPSIASLHPLDRIQTPYSPRCPEDFFRSQLKCLSSGKSSLIHRNMQSSAFTLFLLVRIMHLNLLCIKHSVAYNLCSLLNFVYFLQGKDCFRLSWSPSTMCNAVPWSLILNIY